MSRYIDADKLGIGRADPKIFNNPEYANGWNSAIEIIEKAPAADVEEVKHGCWIDVPINVYNDMYEMNRYNLRTKCSVCTYAMPYEYPRFHICPNCGARMDGGVKE